MSPDDTMLGIFIFAVIWCGPACGVMVWVVWQGIKDGRICRGR